MRTIIWTLLGLMLLTTPAIAQENVCGKREDIVKRLERAYQESNTGMGMASNGRLVELFTSETGTWTLMFTSPNGVSCLIAAGTNWETFKSKLPKPDAY